MNLPAAYDLLETAFRGGRAAHAYLVVAPPRGSGLALIERILQFLFCTGETKPCGVCSGCSRVLKRSHSDVLWIEPQKKSRRIAVEQVREMQGRVYQTSFEGGWRSVVVMGADRLGMEAANAFLKTLEEPPSRCVFFLATDSPQGLLPTILSRCQRISIEGEGEALPEDIEHRLVEILAQPYASPAFAMGRADALSRLLKEIRQAVAEGEAEAAEDDDMDKDTLDARTGARFKEMQAGVMRFMLGWYRDVLMLLSGADDVVYNQRHITELKALAANVTIRQALRNVETVETMYRRLERNVSDGPVFGLGFAILR